MNLFARSASVALGLLAVLGLAACPSKDQPTAPEVCISSEEVRNVAFPTFFQGFTVAEFALRQVYTTYTPNGCKNPTSSISLTITSQALVPVAFSYTLRKLSGTTGAQTWSYNGNVIRLAPGQKIDVGQVSTNLGNITLGAGNVTFNSFSQVP